MAILLGVGFLAGLVTALSPCVLPVLPIVLAGAATGRRPLAIVAGLVASFTAFTLGAAWLLDLLALPQDILRDVAIGLLFVVAATLLVPALGDLAARPFERFARRPAGQLGGGFLLGASLGLVFVPCAGPVLAAITVLAAERDVGSQAILLTAAYATGAAVPLLVIAHAGRSVARRLKANAPTVRRAAGVLIGVAALAIAVGLDRDLQTAVPGYTEALQERIEQSDAAAKRLDRLTGASEPTPVGRSATATETASLPDYGTAPEIVGIEQWLNGGPLSLAELRGKVVLIDFWTYSCINCLRTLPHVKAWDERYRSSGLVIVGVHTPEFAFERVVGNVRENVRRLGIRYPVAIDNGYATWSAWGNRYWPAKYLVDRRGRVRYYHFGEGEYDVSEAAIRELLAEQATHLPASGPLPDKTPEGSLTLETYLGYERLARFAGGGLVRDRVHTYRFPSSLDRDELAYAGSWTVERERIVAGNDARLRLAYRAREVYLVLGGRGAVEARVDGRRERIVRIVADRLYTLVQRSAIADHLLELRISPGVEAYAFTFG